MPPIVNFELDVTVLVLTTVNILSTVSTITCDETGSEGVEAVIKFARAHTGRPGVLYASGGFHGLTCGALSLMDNPFWTAEFGPLLPDTQAVPFGDLDKLAEQ